MPKQYTEYTNFYDYHTIHHAKEITNKKELKQYLYDRWKSRHYGLKVNARTRFKEKIKKAPAAPSGITCQVCDAVMIPSDAMVYDGQYLFIYTCPNNHLPKRAFFSNRMEYRPEDHPETTDEEIFPPPYIISKKDRRKYCLTDVQAMKTKQFFIDHIPQELIRLHEIAQSIESKRAANSPDQVQNLQMVTIPALDDLLKETFNGLHYSHYTSSVKLQREVRLSFSIYPPTTLSEKDLVSILKREVRKLLLATNCRLQSLEFRLGVITGTIRAYESEDEVRELLKTEVTPT